ncbi:MAG: YceI family protein [Panacagrimonas sp.]
MRRFFASLLLATITAAFAASAPIDAGKSQITATFTQMNVPVDGSFKTFTGKVVYDPANLAASSAELSVDTSSFDLGDEDYNAEVRKKEWFDSKAHPNASFKSSTIRALGTDRFEAQGMLTLKGKSLPVKAEVAVKTANGQRSFTGQVPISRKAFAIGDAEWDEVLDDKVVVKFVIVTPAS